MPVDVFISHSSQDKRVADALCTTLESRGVRCWVAPRDILPGEEWAESIVNAIQNSALMLLVFSAHANDSPQVRKEVERAVHHAIPIIPVRIQDVLPNKSLEYFISTPHWLDAMTPPLERHLDHVAGTVMLVLKRQRGEEVPEPLTRTGTQIEYPPTPIPGPAPAPPVIPLPKQSPVLLMALVAVIAIAAAVGIFFATRQKQPVSTERVAATAPAPVKQPAEAAPTLSAELLDHCNRGNAALARFDWETARDEFTQAIKINPQYGPAYTGRCLARVWMSEEGQFAESLADGAKACELDPNSADAHAVYGLAFLETHQEKPESSQYNEALRLDPNCLMAHIGRAMQFAISEEYDAAGAEAEQAVKIDEHSPVSWCAVALVADYMSDWNKCLDATGKAIRIQPEWWYPHAIEAVAFDGLGRNDEGLHEAETAVQLDPNAGFAYQSRGLLEFAAGDMEAALADADKEISLRSQYAEGYALRSMVLALRPQPDLDKALAAAEDAIKRDPHTDAMGIRGWIHYGRGETDLALVDLNNAVKNHPTDPFCHYLRGRVYESKNDYEKALRDYAEGIRLAPGSTLCYEERGRLLITRGLADAGLEDLQKAIDLKPTAATLCYRSWVYSDRKAYDKQLADAVAAMRLDPQNEDALYSKATAEIFLEKWDEAIADLSAVIQMDSKQAKYYTARSIAYNKKGMSKEAQADTDSAAALTPQQAPSATEPTQTAATSRPTTPEGLTVKMIQDDKGRVTEEWFLDAGGTPTPSPTYLGASIVKCTYDSADRVDSCTWCDPSGQPFINLRGYARARYAYNTAGESTDRFFDVQDHPMQPVVVISKVPDDSAGHEAGLLVDDWLWSYDGQRVNTVEQLSDLEQNNDPEPRKLDVLRHGSIVTLSVKKGMLGFEAYMRAIPQAPATQP